MSVRAYAEKTSVPIERSRAEIEGILRRHGATAFGHRWSENLAMIEFAAHELDVSPPSQGGAGGVG